MSTRGFVGFVADGTEKIAYNHYDSYPGGLGCDVLDWLAGLDVDATAEKVRALRVVPSDSVPTREDIERLRGYADTDVGTKSLDDWYVLLRHTQGNPTAMLEAGVIEDASGFPGDSLFAEWGYVVDFDQKVFEVYQGFQREPHDQGRFADRKGQHDGYAPVKLVASWPLDALPDQDGFLAELREGDDE